MKYTLTESQLYFLTESEEGGLKNLVSKSFDDDPKKFAEKLVDKIPQLKKEENSVQSKIIELFRTNPSKIAIIGLISLWISVQLPSIVKSGFDGKKTEQVDNQKSDSLNSFVDKFKEQNPNWGENGQALEISEQKIRKDFIEFVNQGNLSNYPMKLSSIRKFDENRSIILFGKKEYSDNVSAEFISIVSNQMINNYKVGDSCFFKFSIETSEWKNLYNLAKKYNINLWSPTSLRKGNTESKWISQKRDDFSLGFYLTKVNSIEPVKQKPPINQ